MNRQKFLNLFKMLKNLGLYHNFYLAVTHTCLINSGRQYFATAPMILDNFSNGSFLDGMATRGGQSVAVYTQDSRVTAWSGGNWGRAGMPTLSLTLCTKLYLSLPINQPFYLVAYCHRSIITFYSIIMLMYVKCFNYQDFHLEAFTEAVNPT